MNLINFAETGLIPDALIRMGIRRLLSKRLRVVDRSDDGELQTSQFVEELRQSPLAIATDAANDQHYEIPSEFFKTVLGPRLKYSSGYFPHAQTTLAEAEEKMLRLTCQRAELVDGMDILELGCGWGSLTLWMAEHFPESKITAISNSTGQRQFIESNLQDRGYKNVKVITCDVQEFDSDQQFERVVSVEMFEHMRNYELLFHRVSNWLTPEGKAFVHVFCNRNLPYVFETEGASNWMGRHFFTGGTMPSENLFRYFAEDLSIEKQWRISGMHYWRTCEAWLKNLDANRGRILARFEQDVSARQAKRCLQRWRMFFMACAELFRYRGGKEWFVAHYLFQNHALQKHVRKNSGQHESSRESNVKVTVEEH